MHQLILVVAMSTTTGVFGGKHCGGKVRHARPMAQGCYSAAPCGSPSPYGATAMAPVSYPATPQAGPMSYPTTPQAVPATPMAPAPPMAPVPPAPAAPAN